MGISSLGNATGLDFSTQLVLSLAKNINQINQFNKVIDSDLYVFFELKEMSNGEKVMPRYILNNFVLVGCFQAKIEWLIYNCS